MGKQQALIVQNYESLVLVVSQAFGGGDKSSGRTSDTKVVKASTADEMRNAAKGMFG